MRRKKIGPRRNFPVRVGYKNKKKLALTKVRLKYLRLQMPLGVERWLEIRIATIAKMYGL